MHLHTQEMQRKRFVDFREYFLPVIIMRFVKEKSWVLSSPYRWIKQFHMSGNSLYGQSGK